MKMGLFFSFFFFFFDFCCLWHSAWVLPQGREETQQTAHSYALESLVKLQNLDLYSFYLITYFSSLKHSKSTE